MNINFKTLLLGTSLSLIPTITNAQCVATTDCATLGYTEKSCPDGKGIRCPFGTTYACPMSETKFCDKYGFKYECTGTGYASGTGQTCNNKYTSCTCTEGYEWKDGKCEKESGGTLGQCTGYAKNCTIGQILNSDGTCTTNKETGKTPIGVVVYISSGADKCGYAMTASPIQTASIWGGYGTNIPSLPDYTTWQQAIKDFDVTGNMTAILNYGDASTYPAAHAASNYAPSTAPTTKGKWALPTAGILNSLYINRSSVDNAISKLGGTQLMDNNEHIWSSSELSEHNAWLFSTSYGASQGGLDYGGKHSHNYSDITVRPVIAF
ncbi:MAG: hypothetical protein Q4F75_06480 [Pseudomonadota bacterium]|nr:hypothetical protein [Pseudomonadota bacterium]